jgi:hypothetical protein
MDVLTPKGQVTLEQEVRAAFLFEQQYPSMRYVGTPKDSPAVIDAVLIRKGSLYAVAETKCRGATLKQFKAWQYEWLITQDKVERARDIAMVCGVPLVGLLYLVPDDLLLVQRIYNADGSPATAIRTEITTTQATVNGGTAIRNNAFIKVSV